MNIDLPAFLAEHRWAVRDALEAALERLAHCGEFDASELADAFSRELVRSMGHTVVVPSAWAEDAPVPVGPCNG